MFKAICLLFFGAFTITSTSILCPQIITRREWGAVNPSSEAPGISTVTHVVLHHSATPTCNSQVNCKALARSIQKRQMKVQGLRDVAYNFLIAEDGNVYEGVGWGREGSHESRLDSRSLGICMIGDYTSWMPTKKALSAMERLMDCGVQYGYLDPNYKLMAHRQLKDTTCPGTKLYFHIRDHPNWSAGP